MSDIAGRLSALPADKRAALERALLARRRAATLSVQPRDRSRPAPLSATQQRLWFHDQLAPGATTYNAIVAMWVNGALDVDLLEAAVRDSIARHEIIRTVIRVDGDEPVQYALDDWTFDIRRATAVDDAAALAVAAAVAGEPYDLGQDLALRVLVVDVGGDRRLVAFCEHHIAFDGWSDDTLFREIDAYYNAGRAPDREPLPLQFADFAAWQRARLDNGDLDGHVRHWKAVLDGAPAVLEMPIDAPRPARQTFHGRHLPISLPHAVGVRALRAELGATDFMVLVAAWAATLYRWSGQPDIVLGTPMANRNRVELEPLIGFFSNTVPLRVQVEGAQSFADLVRHVNTVVLDAFDHQDLPFERIVEAAAPERDPRVNPLAQVNVRVQSGPLPRLRLDGTTSELVHVDLGFARFDLAVEFQVDDDGIGGYLEFNQDLFTEATARSVLERLDLLLAGVLADPDQSIWDIPQPAARAPRRVRGPR